MEAFPKGEQISEHHWGWVESNKNSTNNNLFFLALKIHPLMLQQGLKNCVLSVKNTDNLKNLFLSLIERNSTSESDSNSVKWRIRKSFERYSFHRKLPTFTCVIADCLPKKTSSSSFFRTVKELFFFSRTNQKLVLLRSLELDRTISILHITT